MGKSSGYNNYSIDSIGESWVSHGLPEWVSDGMTECNGN